jgi:hypothetical protein
VARSLQQRPQMCIASNAGSETAAIDPPQRIDAGLPVAITVAIVETGPSILSPQAIFVCVVWFAPLARYLTSDSTEPESQTERTLVRHIVV